MKIHKINGGYLDQDGPVPVSRQTSKQMATYAVEVLKTEIREGLKGLSIGEALVINVRLAVSRDNPDPGASD